LDHFPLTLINTMAKTLINTMAKKSRKTFSQATKEEAVAAMSIGNLTQKEIAEKYGCSVPALQLWRKELQSPTTDNWDEEEADDSSNEPEDIYTEQETPSRRKRTTKPKQETPTRRKRTTKPEQDTANDVVRNFWNKNYRGVDMLLSPQSIESTEVIKLVNEAIQFAVESK